MAEASSPFNNPGAVPELVEMWRNNLRKSQVSLPPQQQQSQQNLSACININFEGGGQALVVGLAGLVEISFPCRILSCHMFAGAPTLEPVPVTASVELRRGQRGSWTAGGHSLYDTVRPSLTLQAEADISIIGWNTELQPGDLIAFSLYSFTGAATWLTLSMPVRRLDTRGIGETDITAGGDVITDSTGAPVVLRS